MIEYSGYEYVCSANESFDDIALQIYGDENYAADLMNANPQYCGMPVFNGGEVLRLPSIDIPLDDDDEPQTAIVAPWKL